MYHIKYSSPQRKHRNSGNILVGGQRDTSYIGQRFSNYSGKRTTGGTLQKEITPSEKVVPYAKDTNGSNIILCFVLLGTKIYTVHCT